MNPKGWCAGRMPRRWSTAIAGLVRAVGRTCSVRFVGTRGRRTESWTEVAIMELERRSHLTTTPLAGPDVDSWHDLNVSSLRTELVVIDPDIQDASVLAQSFLANAARNRSDVRFQLLPLSRNGSAVREIGQEVRALGRVDAVHVLSHGQAGGVLLGGMLLDDNALSPSAEEMTAWRPFLTPNADILFYGCSIASTDDGQTLLRSIAALTGADTAGSTNLTGDASLGGDWNLEWRTGKIDSTVRVDSDALGDWRGVLANIT